MIRRIRFTVISRFEADKLEFAKRFSDAGCMVPLVEMLKGGAVLLECSFDDQRACEQLLNTRLQLNGVRWRTEKELSVPPAFREHVSLIRLPAMEQLSPFAKTIR